MKNINQPQGPRTGNQNPGTKRADFVKSKTSGPATELARMITQAIGDRNLASSGNPAQAGVNPNSVPRTGIRNNTTAPAQQRGVARNAR
jgi:hypothetical protein